MCDFNMRRQSCITLFILLVTLLVSTIDGFTVNSLIVPSKYKNIIKIQTLSKSKRSLMIANGRKTTIVTSLHSQSTDDEITDEITRTLSAAPLKNESIEINSMKAEDSENNASSAKTNTVNERLMAELQAASDAERGPKTAMGQKFRDNFRYSDKTDEEREAALEAARDLNGVNPTVTILASFFAFGMAYGFWVATQFLGELFLSHPVSADAPYAFARMASVFRNVVMGLSSLASGFAAVSGLGVFLLGVRVAYGTCFINTWCTWSDVLSVLA